MKRFGLTPETLARLLYPETMIFMGCLAVALILISFVVRSRATYSYDLAATLRLQRFETPFFTRGARIATYLGNATTVIALAMMLVVVSIVVDLAPAGMTLVASLFALPLNAILKNIFDRERPGEKEAKIHGGPRWGFSYPSGHSMASAAFYWTLGVLIFLLLPSPLLTPLVVFVVSAIPLATGISRIYLGAHWLSDVVAGWTGGAIVALAASALYAPLT
ncbi:phosphatase PAP2 family protein [bacterium]|nr:MAG: phosphatase PAP2 family protein [bacterium]